MFLHERGLKSTSVTRLVAPLRLALKALAAVIRVRVRSEPVGRLQIIRLRVAPDHRRPDSGTV